MGVVQSNINKCCQPTFPTRLPRYVDTCGLKYVTQMQRLTNDKRLDMSPTPCDFSQNLTLQIILNLGGKTYIL